MIILGISQVGKKVSSRQESRNRTQGTLVF